VSEPAPSATAAVTELATDAASPLVPASASRPSRNAARIPSLDGLRAVSILLVVAWHLRSSGSAPWLEPLWRIDTGNLGVRVFFVISGFLITSVLLAEYERSGTIGLRRFYVRRAFRIMPVFYVFLAVIAIAGAVGLVEAPFSSILLAAAYTADYTHVVWSVGHTWSLAVEEQFYLLWPGLIVLLGVRRAFLGAAVMLLISPTVRTLAIVAHWPTFTRYAFEGVADALATGCLLAYSRAWLWDRALYRRMLDSKAMYLCVVVIGVIAAANVRWQLFGALAGISLLNITIAVLIDWCLRFPDTWLGRFLNARPIAFVGVLSYSIYLWQQPFLREKHSMLFPLNIACIGALALVTYYAVEKPFLRLRARLEAASI
jgi:peptidoglycan/LPS O-acetylase OafA/YrhL